MIKPFGPPTCFVTFTIGINNWPELIKALEESYVTHKYKNDKLSRDAETLKIVGLVRMDPGTCAQYYEKRIGWFQKLLKKCDLLFGQLLDYFFRTNFQSGGYPHDYGLLWIANVP